MNFIGYAHCFISISISQLRYHCISVDQARYATFFVAKYLDTATIKANSKFRKTNLPHDMIHSEAVEKYTPTTRTLSARQASHLLISQIWEIYRRKQDEKVDMEKKQDVSKKKNRNVYFCVAYSRYFSTSIHRVVNRLKNSFNLSWLRV